MTMYRYVYITYNLSLLVSNVYTIGVSILYINFIID